MFSDKALREFKKIWKKEFGKDIADEKAAEEGINLLTMFDAVYRPIKKEWVKDKDQPKNQ